MLRVSTRCLSGWWGALSSIEIPPKPTLASFDAVLDAQQRAKAKINDAQTTAKKVLMDAAGPKGEELAGQIELWWAAKDRNQPEEMEKAEAKMRELYAQAGGQCKTILSSARAYQVDVENSAKSDALSFNFLDLDIKMSPSNGRLLAYLADKGKVLSRTFTDDRVTVHCHIDRRYMAHLATEDAQITEHPGNGNGNPAGIGNGAPHLSPPYARVE